MMEGNPLIVAWVFGVLAGVLLVAVVLLVIERRRGRRKP